MQGVQITLQDSRSGGQPHMVRVQFEEGSFTTASAAAWWASHKAELEWQFRLGPDASESATTTSSGCAAFP